MIDCGIFRLKLINTKQSKTKQNNKNLGLVSWIEDERAEPDDTDS